MFATKAVRAWLMTEDPIHLYMVGVYFQISAKWQKVIVSDVSQRHPTLPRDPLYILHGIKWLYRNGMFDFSPNNSSQKFDLISRFSAKVPEWKYILARIVQQPWQIIQSISRTWLAKEMLLKTLMLKKTLMFYNINSNYSPVHINKSKVHHKTDLT